MHCIVQVVGEGGVLSGLSGAERVSRFVAAAHDSQFSCEIMLNARL